MVFRVAELDFALDGILARLADGREHVFHNPVFKLAGIGHPRADNKAIKVRFVDGDHRSPLTVRVLDCHLLCKAMTFVDVLGVNDLAAVVGNCFGGILVTENFAHIVGDEPRFLVFVREPSDMVCIIKNAVTESQSPCCGRVEFLGLNCFVCGPFRFEHFCGRAKISFGGRDIIVELCGELV